jgi:hypothetical protein
MARHIRVRCVPQKNDFFYSTRVGSHTLLGSAVEALRLDLSPRAEELAQKSTSGTLSADEQAEYAEIVRINDTLSLLKLQAEEFSAHRVAS